MTNLEKYKTAEEKGTAFRQFCESHICDKCPLLDICDLFYGCILNWLGMEAKEELLRCPFCGANATPHEVFGVRPHVQCNTCGVLMYGDTSSEAIAAWNRRAK